MAHDLKREAAEVIFELLTTAYPRLSSLRKWYHKLLDTLDKWSNSEGNQGVKRMKMCLSQVSKLALKEELDKDIDYLSTLNGIPTVVIPFADFVQKGSMATDKLTVVLSLCRITDLYEGKPTDKDILSQVEIISSTVVGKKAEIFAEKLGEFITHFLEAYPKSAFADAWNKNMKIENPQLARSSRGPNGALTENAHLDALTLREYMTSDNVPLSSVLCDLQKEISLLAGQGFEPSSYLKQSFDLSPIKDYVHAEVPGKLSIIPEKSAKLRLIAQPDYFTQESLNPLHMWLQNVLDTFPTDYTKDQQGAAAAICEWTTIQENNYIASYDQSSCTDRFPFIVQESVLSKRFGSKFTSLVHKVMVDREFKLTLPSGTVRKVRWSAGQPLGLYASWPLMALTHHLIVQWCAYEVCGRKFNKEPFAKYCILGDDIVIADHAVADKYLRTVRELGMKVNLTKSHVSGTSTGIPPVAEFAKVIYWKGQILQTIKPKQVLSALKDWRMAIPLFQFLVNHPHLRFKRTLVDRLIRNHWSKNSKILTYLRTIPQVLGGMGYSDTQSLKHRISASVQAGRVDPLVWFIALRVKAKAKRLIDGHNEMTLVVKQLPSSVRSKHPVGMILEESNILREFKTHGDVLREISEKTNSQLVLDILKGHLTPWLDILLSENQGMAGLIWSDGADLAQDLGSSWFEVFRNYYDKQYHQIDPCLRPDTKRFIGNIICAPNPAYDWTTINNQYRVIQGAIEGLNKDKSLMSI